MDGKYTPENKGYRIITRQYDVVYSINAHVVRSIDFGDVRYNGKMPFSINQIYLGNGNLVTGGHSFNNYHEIVYVYNPSDTALSNITASIVLNYYVSN